MHTSALLTWLNSRIERVLLAAWILLLGVIVIGVNASDPVQVVNARIRLTGDRPTILMLGCALVAAAVFAAPWERMRPWIQAWVSIAAIVMVWPLQYHVLPWTHEHGILILLPVLCLAVRHRGRYVVIGLGAAVVSFWLPIIDGHRTFMDVVDHGFVFAGLVAVAGAIAYLLVEQTRAQTQLIEDLAHTDSLTGVANRRGWDQHLPRLLAEARRGREPLTVALVDFDRFKKFNDERGHPAGDGLLRESARQWRSIIREVDYLARWGGDEFALAFPMCSGDQAIVTLQRMAAATPLGQTYCFGIAEWDGGESLDRLIVRADEDLYAAKRLLHEPALVRPLRSRAGLGSHLLTSWRRDNRLSQ